MMKAVILAGGKGLRLRPYTTVLPKPLMPIDDVPILEIVIRQLAHYGLCDITIAVNHLAELIMAFFGDGSKFGVKINYSIEDKPMGTAGPLSLIESLRDCDDVLVVNGDLLTTLDFANMKKYHEEGDQSFTIGMYHKEFPIELGVLEVDDNMRISKFIEKPTITRRVSMGINMFQTKHLDLIPKDEHFDLPDLISLIISQDEIVKGYLFKDSWLDIGQPKDYDLALKQFEENREQFLKPLRSSAK